MPCYDSRPRDKAIANVSKLKDAARSIEILEGYLCAIMSELESRGIAESVIVNASRNGLIDLVGFWKYHKENDRARLLAEIHKFSVDEQKVIKQLLNGED